MAKRRSSLSTSQVGRDPLGIANRRLLDLDDFRPSSLARAPRAFSFAVEVEDRRTWWPDDLEPFKTATGSSARVVVGQRTARTAQAALNRLLPIYPPSVVAFEAPRRVLVCLRRQRRKEVLHAIGVAGSRFLRKPRRTAASGVSCKG